MYTCPLVASYVFLRGCYVYWLILGGYKSHVVEHNKWHVGSHGDNAGVT